MNGLMALKLSSELTSKFIKSPLLISDSVTARAAATPWLGGCQELGAELCKAIEDVCETKKLLSYFGSELKHRFESKLL